MNDRNGRKIRPHDPITSDAFGDGTVVALVAKGWPALTSIDQVVVQFESLRCEVPANRVEVLTC